MPSPNKYDIPDVGGGLQQGFPATRIEDRQMVELANFYPFGTRLITRKPVTQLTGAAYGEQLTSVMALRTATGEWTVVVGAATGLAVLDGTSLTALPISSGATSFASSTRPWDFHQYVGMGYAMRQGVGLKRFTADQMGDAGIADPTGGATMADGAAGDVEAGDYIGVYTYYNTETGAESNPSPVSNTLSAAGSKQIDWTGIGVSTNGQVDARRLYRTLPNQTGEYFYVGQINDNFTTVFTDDIPLDDLGDTISWDNAEPPAGLRFGDLWMERFFATDGTYVYFSESSMPESWAEDSIIEVFTDDGHEIRGICAFGDRLIIGKTNKVHYVVNTGPRKFERYTLSDRHGVWSHASMKVAEGWLYWYGGDNVYRSNGTTVEGMGSYAIKKILAAVPDDQKEEASAAIYESLNWYVLTLPQNTSGTDRITVVCNYKTGAWTTFKHVDLVSGDTAPTFIGEVYDEDYGKQLYAVFDDANHLYRYQDEDATALIDRGQAVECMLKTKAFGLENRGLLKALRRVFLLVTTVSQTITLRLYRDGNSAATKSRTVSLNQGRGWKLYNLNSSRELGATLQLGIEYNGTAELELDELAVDTMEFLRTGRAV